MADQRDPIIIAGQPLGDSVEFKMDGEARTCTIVMRPALAIEPISVCVGFALLKQTVGQVLAFEVGMEAARLARLGQTPPLGLEHKQYAGAMLAKEAAAEMEAAQKAKATIQQVPGFDA